MNRSQRPAHAGTRDGFTLIELMIVVVIIGILAAIAIPKFGAASRSAKEAEADGILKQAYSLQETYAQRYDRYADGDANLALVGWASQTGRYFQFNVKNGSGAPGSGGTFCVEAAPAGSGVGTVSTRSIRQDRTIALGACP